MRRKDGIFWITVSLMFILVVGTVMPVYDFDNDLQSTGIVSVPERGIVFVAGTPHAPIVIDGDANFSDTALAEGWSGNGSSLNPFIIDGLDIDLGGTVGHCINITNTRVNFTISNCYFTGANVSAGAGIYLDNVTYGKLMGNIIYNNVFNIYLAESNSVLIKNNTCTDSVYSISLRYSSTGNVIKDNNCSHNSNRGINLESGNTLNTVVNNTCNNNVYGIVLFGVSYNVVMNNTFNYNSNDGIHVNNADMNTLDNNTCTNNSKGIYLFSGADSNDVTNSICTSNTYGIYVESSSSITVANNTCSSNTQYGIYLESFGSSTVANNTCSSNSQGIFFESANSITVVNNTCTSNAGHGILFSSLFSCTVANNTCNSNSYVGMGFYAVISVNIVNNTCSSNTGAGIRFVSYSDSNTLANNICNNNEDGIYVRDSNSNTLVNNICNNNEDGIYVRDSNSNTLANNTCSNNYWGIFLYSSSSNTLVNNTLNDCGIYVSGSLTDCRQLQVKDNVVNTLPLVFLQDKVGITVSSPAGQIILINCSQITVQNQTLNNCSVGVLLRYTSLTTLANSTCTNNEYGVIIGSGANNNDILWNILMNNTMNAIDQALNNFFDYNYWSDYTGYDADENGIGDTPYSFSGNEDLHPFMAPLGSPPFWLEFPIDQVVFLGEVFRYDLNASVYGGLDHWWINDTANFAIGQSGVVTNITFLLAENYGLRVYANDTEGNILSGIFTVIVEDWSLPIWLETPANKQVECGVALHYYLNATDSSGLDSWWLNDTLHFAIDDDGHVTTINIVPVGVYGVQVWVNDTWGNPLTGFFTVTVIDTLAPTWVEQPQNQIIEYGATYICDLNATDPSGIDEWWVDDTLRFTVDWTGQIRMIDILEPGVYGLVVYVSDIYDHILSIAILVEVLDTTPPQWLTDVTDQYLEYGEDLEYQLSASDISGIDYWILNDTLNFEISLTGRITYKVDLLPGTYNLLVSVFDPYGNILSAEFTVFVTEVITTSTTTTTTTTTSTTTTTTTTTTTNTSTSVDEMNPLLALGLGAGIGGVAVIVIVIVFLRRKS